MDTGSLGAVGLYWDILEIKILMSRVLSVHIKFSDLNDSVCSLLCVLLCVISCSTESGAAVCEYFMRNMCNRGPVCPFRHTKGEKTVVCKHWLRGLCKKGDQCEFLHEYDMTKMPECYFYSKFGECTFLFIFISHVCLRINVKIY